MSTREDRRTPRCEIVPFPSARRLEKVRQTALLLLDATSKPKLDAHYRSKIFGGIENQFLKVGVSQERATAQRLAFEQAVADEMNRIDYEGVRAQPDGGAS
ncbi:MULTISPECIES: DUF6074 family protein [unclassified Aureimonas]|uniref:DUF6074 family protein n=1 Tax=unclassified Aureimonas TaxID=2615206 RepID=UPI0006F962CD|nr:MULTISPECIES: DUF6074 family protein [unclassified Aureimonas]KQT57487.1 hypothetical protein ASG62_09210 [Aureimonas sp. Leaf427]KQT77167.1 hypothetical protein ASG54_13080 [Aureimonas sp. Leaf460]